MTGNTLEQRAAMVRAMADVVLESTGETRESVGDIAFGWVCEVQEKALEAALRLSAGADCPDGYEGSVMSGDAESGRVTFVFATSEQAERWHEAMTEAWDAAPRHETGEG